jgi:hypothetical protein
MLGDTLAPRFHRVLTTAALTLGLAGAAHAQDSKSYPGTMCQASGTQQTLSYGLSGIANLGDGSMSAICPLVRDNLSAPWDRVTVYVRDRHTTQNVCCTAYARNEDGTAGTNATECTTGEGYQTLSFASLPGVPDLGPYFVLCQIPGVDPNGSSSYISSYRIQEP